jgi:hypothetical protein
LAFCPPALRRTILTHLARKPLSGAFAKFLNK